MLGIDIEDPDRATKEYVNDAIAAIGGGGGEAAQNSFLVSGGQVTWQNDYEFLVSAANYYIGGVLYSSPQTTITLDASDVTLDRIDTIAVDDQGDVVKVTGTAASTPSEPDIDPGTQLKLAIVSVPAASTEPETLGNVTIYAENAGSPTEWAATASAGSISVNSTNQPRNGTKTIEGTNVVSGVYAQLQIGSGTFNPNDYAFLIINIKSKAQWNPNRGLQVTLRNAGVVVGQTISINRSGTFGFDSSATASYQQVAIPISQFAVPIGTVITQVRITDFGGSIGFYLDDISFQVGATTQVPTGITQAQADARYVQLSTFKGTIGYEVGDGVNAIVAGASTRRVVRCPYSGTIAASLIMADQTGTFVVEIQKNPLSSYPPTTSIVASAPPTLSGTNTEDRTLTGWTKTVAAGDVFEFTVSSAATVTWAKLQLEINRTN